MEKVRGGGGGSQLIGLVSNAIGLRFGLGWAQKEW